LGALRAWPAWGGGAASGAAAGLGAGLTADLCAGGGGGTFTAAMGLGGLLCGQYHGGKRWRAAGLFLLGTAAAVLASGGIAGDGLYSGTAADNTAWNGFLSGAAALLAECALGMVLFLTLPRRMAAPQPEQEAPAAQSAEAWTSRLERAAAALRELYDACAPEEEPEEGPSEVFDRAAERVCRTCPLCSVCWENSYASTFQSLNDAVPRLLDRGRLLSADLPARFTDRCVRLGEFLSAVNTELSAYLLRRQYRRRLAEARTGARRQYAQMSELLSSAAAGVRMVPAFGEERCRLGLELRPRRGENVCGDAADTFRRSDGLWCLVLADGMGSGEGARRESALTCRLLRQFLEAGVQAEAALKTLNAAMSLRGEETGSFPTLDVCTFDPAAGEASFYKYGAAPSYLKKGGVVRRISASSLPMGLQSAPTGPDVTRTRLEPGSFAVLVSDGVAEAEQDEWLQDLLAGWEGEDPQALARTILEESAKRRKLSDDCAVLALYRPETGARRT
ncbi:MAG: SpoIIE family protein phosphatase, partial [Oscillibacter sp.]|nr:SpoIIE family protein phosphatase [Oscillibacter sp.]